MWESAFNLARRIRNDLVLIPRWVWWVFLPVKKKKIVVSAYGGKGYCDNPKYIVEELLKRRNDLEIIWLLKDPKEAGTLPEGVTACNARSTAAAYHLATAQIWIDNVRKVYLYKKKDQFYFQTWHGIGAMKRAENDAVEGISPNYLQIAKKDSKAIDLFLSSTEYESRLYHHSYWYDGRILEVGYPRNDILIKETDVRKRLCGSFKIPEESGIILYAPTFRNDPDQPENKYSPDFERLIEACKIRFGLSSCVVLLRLHPNLTADDRKAFGKWEYLLDVSDHSDGQELLVAADIMISDYSSIMVDFSLTGKPVFRYAPDLDDYLVERNFYLDFNEYPYPYARTDQELTEQILNFDEREYQQDLEVYFEKVGMIKNEHASGDCADIILDYADRCSKEELYRRFSGWFASFD